MKKSGQRAVIIIVAVMGLLYVAGLLTCVRAQSRSANPTLQFLGVATNYLKYDKDRSWKTFSVSNAWPKTISYSVTEVDFRTNERWTSNSWPAASLMTRRESPGMVSPGSSDVFYAAIPNGVTPWRIHVLCSVTNRHFSWENGTYELISAEITP